MLILFQILKTNCALLMHTDLYGFSDQFLKLRTGKSVAYSAPRWGIWEAGPPDGSGIVCAEIKIYTSNSFLYSAFYNVMYTFKGFSKIHQPFPDM